ncbi:MAG: S9 family peptidase [Synergistaceae bacterium]|nr:S9 family peptidase [Synergistaceae bacterium]
MSKNNIKRVELHDILKYKFLSSPKFSPDGNIVAFKVSNADVEANNYKSYIWLYYINEEVLTQLTSFGSEGAFCWSVDGREILFVSNRDLNNQVKNSEIYKIDIHGGEARLKFKAERSISELWDTASGLLIKNLDLREPEKLEGADYMIFTQIPFCSNGSNYTAQRRNRLSLIKAEDFIDLTPESMDVLNVKLNQNKIYFAAKDYEDVMPLTTGIFKIDLNNLSMSELLEQGHYTWACADEFNDKLLLTGTDMKRYGLNENKKFFVLNNENNLECFTPELDSCLDNRIVCDCRYGIKLDGAEFVVDNGKAYYISTEDYKAYLYELNAQGKIKKLTESLSSVDDFDVKNNKAAVIALENLNLQELYIIEEDCAKCVTSFNAEALKDLDLSKPEYAHIENGTPEGLDCWYMRPINFEVGKKYPAILHIHGGPKVTFGDVFDHEMQLLAAQGWAVIFCNPRGAAGKGDKFADIRGGYGTVDYDDIMTLTDWAVKTLPFIDENRLGVTGGSYGGYMTNWIIGHTNKFCAAVTQRSISNWTSKEGMSDIGYYFVPDQQLADIGEDISALWDCSPLKFANQVRTPTLFIHSDQDQRCELGQGLQFFTALKKNGIEAKICVFKGENHDLSRNGRPKPRLARLGEIVKWFREHF